MEIQLIQAKSHMHQPKHFKSKTNKKNDDAIMTTTEDYNTTSWFEPLGVGYGYLSESNVSLWNTSDVLNITNTTDFSFDYDYRTVNATATTVAESWSSCKDWTAAQHNLFQTANFFFAAAFLVPGSFKQSVLLVR